MSAIMWRIILVFLVLFLTGCNHQNETIEKSVNKTKAVQQSLKDTCGSMYIEKYIGQKLDDDGDVKLRKILPQIYKLRIFDERNGPAYGTLDKKKQRLNIFVDHSGVIYDLRCF